MSLVVKTRAEIRYCESCKSSHMGRVPCGLTYSQRIRSMRVDQSWMPAKIESRASGETEYYDDQQLSALFDDGLTGEERKEQLMDETQGVGYATAEDIQKYPELVAAHYLDAPGDDVEADDD